MLRNLPLKQPKPDARRFVDTLMGRESSARPPLVEYLVDDLLLRQIVPGLLGRSWVERGEDRASQRAYLDNFIEFWYQMGYDFVRFEQGLGFPENKLLAPDTAPDSDKDRAWADEHHGSIGNWDDFERYPWPSVEAMDFSAFEYISQNLPEGMGLIACHAGGVFEHLSWIMSYEGLCLALHEDRDLVRAVSDRLGGLMVRFYEHLLDLDRVIAIFPGDDMGFRTGTLISPSDLREFCLPWHRRFGRMAHHRGLPYFLHSCGNILAIMEDLISDIGIDGKHSFEDAVIPVQDFQARYGHRIAVLGGVDLNILGAASTEEVRARTRSLIETCGGRGRYAVGSGNSIPSYIPVPNYLAMIDEALTRPGGPG